MCNSWGVHSSTVLGWGAQNIGRFYGQIPWHTSGSGGDYKNLLDLQWDKLDPKAQSIPTAGKPTPFSRLVGELGLVDVWRLKYPNTKMYSCHSAAYEGLSRIDLGLGNQHMLPFLADSQYEVRQVSDHSPFWVDLAFHIVLRHFSWKLNPFWLSLFPEPDPIPELITSFLRSTVDSANIGVVWDPPSKGLFERAIYTCYSTS